MPPERPIFPRLRLRVFVSSCMGELADERSVVKEALAALRVDAFVFEADAGARPGPAREAFLDELEASDLYLGIFWKRYGVMPPQKQDTFEGRGGEGSSLAIMAPAPDLL